MIEGQARILVYKGHIDEVELDISRQLMPELKVE